jgi:hypothetical protein
VTARPYSLVVSMVLALAVTCRLSRSSRLLHPPARGHSLTGILMPSDTGKSSVARTVPFICRRKKKEKEVGAELSAEVERSARLLHDPSVTAYLAALTQNIAGDSDAQMPIMVTVSLRAF